MKNIIVLIFTCLGLISNAIYAQKSSICESLFKILDATAQNFDELKGAKSGNVFLSTIYETKLQIEGVDKNYIEDKQGNVVFVIDFGQFNTESEAEEKVRDLTSKITNYCNSNIKFFKITAESDDKLYKVAYYTQEFVRIYNTYFYIANRGGKFFVSLKANGNQGDGGITTPKPAFRDFHKITNKVVQSDFSDALQRVMKASSTSFVSLKGEKLPSGDVTSTFNKVNFMLPGYEKCYLSTNLENETSYNVIMSSLTSADEIKTRLFDVDLKKVSDALGEDFAIGNNLQNSGYEIVRLNHPEKVIMEVYGVREEQDKYSVILSIH